MLLLFVDPDGRVSNIDDVAYGGDELLVVQCGRTTLRAACSMGCIDALLSGGGGVLTQGLERPRTPFLGLRPVAIDVV